MVVYPEGCRAGRNGVRAALRERVGRQRLACSRSTHFAIVASVALLSACATTNAPQPRDFDESLHASAFILQPDSYRFTYFAHGVDYERDVVGLISTDDGQMVSVQYRDRLLRGHEPCRIDITGQLESSDSEFEVRCGAVRLKLHQVNGEIVDGTGFTQVRTNQGFEQCGIRNGRKRCLRRVREGRARVATGSAWRSGSLRLERLTETGGTRD